MKEDFVMRPLLYASSGPTPVSAFAIPVPYNIRSYRIAKQQENRPNGR